MCVEKSVVIWKFKILKWGGCNKMGGLENFVKILKWGGYNKRELAEKNGRKIKGAPPP